MIPRAAVALVALMAALAHPALASCGLREQPTKRVDVESGIADDTLTKNRGEWDEEYVNVVARDGNARSGYVRVADDSRFGENDPSYEAGTYIAVTPGMTLNAIANISPTHQVLPGTSLEGGLDLSGNAGFDYSVEYAQRDFTLSDADVSTIGLSRYFGSDRLAATMNVAHLSNVPGLAVSEGLSFARYLACDSMSFSVSTGRDVESTGVGSNVAVYQANSYDINDLHWFTPHFALNVGGGWYLLVGAYSRFEIRIAVHERL